MEFNWDLVFLPKGKCPLLLTLVNNVHKLRLATLASRALYKQVSVLTSWADRLCGLLKSPFLLLFRSRFEFQCRHTTYSVETV
jgi:hypothetical protein